MALATYSDLQSSVASFMARSDLTGIIPDLITLFEARANRSLRVRQMEATSTLTPSSGAVTLPSDFLEWRRVTFTGDPLVELSYVTPSWLRWAYPDTPSDTPKHFTIEGSSLLIRPTSSTNIELRYYQKIPALSVSNTTNWLLTAHPDYYLFGTLVEAHLYVMNPDGAAAWKQREDGALIEIIRLDQVTRGPAAMMVQGATP